ncbi:P-loop containing nucleoside triphosphate hydrolase protein [Amylocarpus encephaloides]|uniref:P-loop containing nucleoside triphosphate hydrolase protein n=1 Tax=Amylocarpus encephaloides TaxID=45428 RepID=A0A9P8C498_9HELO|nr:P-loop containing nucleoside triphosphate hydrolase protein [Amylocarpus encephaloides]
MEIPEYEAGKLTAYQLLLATNTLRGYSLKDKSWLKLDLNGFKEMSWNDRAFSSLILPNDTKDLQFQSFDDVIEGKGKGIIMLLSGPPGVGRTLTSEAVAETMRVPLYMISAGDLGTEPTEVEKSLKDILAMVTKWKVARSTHDLECNKLLSIFLRTLEYFDGFLFLTSNRVDNIDGAFESQIHLSLQIDSLSFESRRHVWVKLLENMGRREAFDDAQIDVIAGIELNGRQIKNILKTSQLLAASKDSKLAFDHVLVITKLRAANAWNPPKST